MTSAPDEQLPLHTGKKHESGIKQTNRCPSLVVVVGTNDPEAIFPVQRLNLGILELEVSHGHVASYLD